MQPIAIVSALLPILAAATPVHPRAGGPVAVPIPSNCSTDNPLPKLHGGNGFQPTGDFEFAHELYWSYYTATGKNPAQECFEQCYGYGNPGDCQSAFFADNVPTPKGYYGAAGGKLQSACLLFSQPALDGNYTVAPSGQYVNASAININCPIEG